MRVRTKAMAAAAALSAALLSLSAPPAQAGTSMHVTGLACPGGYIATRMFFYTDNETGYTDNYAGNSFDIHLYNYDWDENLHISVKCNNGVWYYPVRRVTGSVSPRYLSWI